MNGTTKSSKIKNKEEEEKNSTSIEIQAKRMEEKKCLLKCEHYMKFVNANEIQLKVAKEEMAS